MSMSIIDQTPLKERSRTSFLNCTSFPKVCSCAASFVLLSRSARRLVRSWSCCCSEGVDDEAMLGWMAFATPVPEMTMGLIGGTDDGPARFVKDICPDAESIPKPLGIIGDTPNEAPVDEASSLLRFRFFPATFSGAGRCASAVTDDEDPFS